MNRRGFLSSVGYVGSAIIVGATIPRAFLGDPAGGFYAPIPDDLTPYLRDHGERSLPSGETLRIHSLHALWAPPGARFGEVAMFAGTMLYHRSPTREQIVNRNDSICRLLRRHHEPGWFLVREGRHLGAVDEDGDPVETSVEVWKRIGYLKWLPVAEMREWALNMAVPT